MLQKLHTGQNEPTAGFATANSALQRGQFNLNMRFIDKRKWTKDLDLRKNGIENKTAHTI